jgi:hypothetical protein
VGDFFVTKKSLFFKLHARHGKGWWVMNRKICKRILRKFDDLFMLIVLRQRSMNYGCPGFTGMKNELISRGMDAGDVEKSISEIIEQQMRRLFFHRASV